MSQFDVYRNPNRDSAKRFPFLLVVQSNLLDRLASRVVVPLMPLEDAPGCVTTLNPVFDLEGARYMALTQELAGISARSFGTPIANLAPRRQEILAALDFILSGV